MKINEKPITRRQAISGLGAGVSLLALSGCQPSNRAYRNIMADQSPAAQLETIAYNLLQHEPERATGLGVDTGQRTNLRARLEDQSAGGQRRYADRLRIDLSVAQAIDTNALDADTRTSFEVVESAYAIALDGFALPYGDVAVGSWRNSPYVVCQNVGTYIDMPRFLSASHPLKTDADAEAYVSRLEAMPSVLDGERDRIRTAREMGLVPPDFVLDKAIAQMRSTIADAGDDGGLLVTPLRAYDATYGARATPIVTGNVKTALEAQLVELEAQRAVATSAPGLSTRPRGDEWYTWGLRASTTTTLTPDEVHERGLEELAALHARMDPILRDIGYTKGTVGERMQGLGKDPRYKFADGDPGRAEILAFIRDRIDWITAQMPRAFNTLVDPPVEIRRIPPNEELGAPAAYGGAGSKDGSIPGRMWINLRTTDLHRKYDLADLTYHETIPGHVWEGEYSNRLPLIRSILAFNSFSEGWALYGEQLADELGAYDDFTVGQLGYLQALAFRACRLVVDTGLHHKGWSRERAVAFFVERNGSKPEEVASEVDRYCTWPGQACGYKVGHSEIVRQRALAEAALGQAYDMKAFNDAVILGGNAPLDVLATNVARYIAQAKGG
ncbi:MAG: DUF885 domain-containing protein [Parerythrobacter sp.]